LNLYLKEADKISNTDQMKKEKSTLTELLFWAAIAGNTLYILWITYNGIKERFDGTPYEKMSYISLMGLLVVNSFLLLLNRRNEGNEEID
jgi:hypothetical protein